MTHHNHHNAERGPWLTPGLIPRLVELHAERLVYRQIAEILSMEFERDITRNAIIGKTHRLNLPTLEKPPKVAKPRKRKPRPRARVKATDAEPPIAALRMVVPAEGISLLDLNDDVCHWPFGEHPDITYCGQPLYQRSYCCGHFHLAYVTPHVRHPA